MSPHRWQLKVVSFLLALLIWAIYHHGLARKKPASSRRAAAMRKAPPSLPKAGTAAPIP